MINRKLELEKYLPKDNLLEGADLDLLTYTGKNDLTTTSYRNYAEDSDKIDVAELLRRLRKHKWLIFSIIIIITTIAAIQAFRTKPWYTSSTVIEVGKENSMVL